jgi:hypothetical protein
MLAYLRTKKLVLVVVVGLALAAVVVAPVPLWLRLVGVVAVAVAYWRYAWKYEGIREQTLDAIEQERQRLRRPPSQ